VAPNDDVYVDAGNVSATISAATGGNFESLAINPHPPPPALRYARHHHGQPDRHAKRGRRWQHHLHRQPEQPGGHARFGDPFQWRNPHHCCRRLDCTVSVAAPSDDVYLDSGSVSTTIASATGGNFEVWPSTQRPAATSITDTLDTVTVSLSADAAAAEGGNITYTASLNHVAQTPVSVTLSSGATITIAAGSATARSASPRRLTMFT